MDAVQLDRMYADMSALGHDTVSVLADRLTPVHEAWDVAKVARLSASMAADGWVGAPLIGWDQGDEIWLFNGSHRWAAARAMGIEVPVILLEVTYEQLVGCGACLDNVWGIYFPERARSLPGGASIPLDGKEG